MKELIISLARSGTLVRIARLGVVDATIGGTVMGVEVQSQEANTSVSKSVCWQWKMAKRARQER